MAVGLVKQIFVAYNTSEDVSNCYYACTAEAVFRSSFIIKRLSVKFRHIDTRETPVMESFPLQSCILQACNLNNRNYITSALLSALQHFKEQ